MSPKKSKRSAKITRASALTRECTSLPSLEPYRHRLHLHLRRAAGSVSGQRCSSAQPSEFSQSTKATNVKPVFELPLSPSKREDSMSIVSFTHLSPSSPTSSLSLENYTITTRPPSRHGIAYEIVFDVPSVQRCYTPELRLSSDHTYSFPRATTKFMAAEELNDDWNSDGEFEDSDESESEEKAVDEKKESGSEQKANLSLPVPECKYGVFFTAAKPPLPPSALERIRRYRNYEL